MYDNVTITGTAMPKKKPETDAGASSGGRPRSIDATDAARRVALELAYEGGIANATIERIAQQSGVAKTTIYRRWPSANAVVMDAFLAEISPAVRYTEKATIAATIRAAIRQIVKALEGPRGQLLRHLLAAAQADDELQRAFWVNWMEPRRAQAKAVIARAQLRHELRSDIDVDVTLDMVFGSVFYRLMIPYARLDDAFANGLVAQVFDTLLEPP